MWWRNEARAAHWPWGLVAAGILTMLPIAPIQGVVVLAEEFLLTVAHQLAVWKRTVSPDEVSAASELRPEPLVLDALADAAQAILPPRVFAGGGQFHVIPVGEIRRPDFHSLVVQSPIPEGVPVLLGNVRVGDTVATTLVGFTAQRGGKSGFVPLTAAGFRAAAFAGDPRRSRGVSFVVSGTNSHELSGEGPERRSQIKRGDLVWADPRTRTDSWSGGWELPDQPPLILGTVATASPSETDLVVDPVWRSDWLRDVAILLPSDAEPPTEYSFRHVLVHATSERADPPNRKLLWLREGWESGLGRGVALTRSTVFVGRILRAGWKASWVRQVEDPGFRCSVSVLQEGQCHGWELISEGGTENSVRVAAPPRDPSWEGALLVTDGSSPQVPPGLSVGVLERSSDGWRVRRPVEEGPLSAHVFAAKEATP